MPSALSNAKYGCGFRNRLDDGWHRLHGSLTPLRLSQIVLIALRRFTARPDRFTLGLRLVRSPDEKAFPLRVLRMTYEEKSIFDNKTTGEDGAK